MNEREDYLDKLLRGMDDESEDAGAVEDYFRDMDGTVSMDGENDFLKAFEQSKSQTTDEPEFGQETDMAFDMGDIDDIVSNVKNGTLEELNGFGDLEEGMDLSIDESLQNFDGDSEELDEIGTEYASNESNYEVNTLDTDQEVDFTSGEANQELLDMLSGIGDENEAEEDFQFSQEDFMAEESEEPAAMDETQTIGDSSSAEERLAKELEGLGLDLEDESTPAKEEAPKTDDKASGEQAEKGEKAGFFQKFSDTMFGGEELIELSEEEAKALDEKENKEAAAKAEEKERKKQQKKEAKEQKKKEKAEKKALKEQKKKEKPKKEKPPRVIEKTKPLPKGPVVLIMMVGISLVLLIILFSNQVGYSLSIAQAKTHYQHGNYVEAYACFEQGSKVKAADEELYNKARLTAYIQQPINSYKVYQKQKMYDQALSALILGVGRYDKNGSEAASVGASVEYDNMLDTIEKALKKKYNMTLEQARELYGIREKKEYTLALYQIIEELGLAPKVEE